MNLIIDVGNTLVKIGVFQNKMLLEKQTHTKEYLPDAVKSLLQKYPVINNALLSSVSDVPEEIVQDIEKLIPLQLLDHKSPLPFVNRYTTPSTLGVDRLGLVAAAVGAFPRKNVLVIDCGTCITYDFKNGQEEYLGGAISPGLQLRYQSLHRYTSRLPLLSPEFPKSSIGVSTNEAIHTGVVKGIINEIDGVIDDYCNTYPDLTVILTGGDAHFLSKNLKNSIFATSNFLLEGLNHILVFNNSQ